MALHASTAQPAQVPLTRAHKPRPVELKTPRLSIVVVNYRQWEKTHEMVRQLLATAALRSGDAEIIIVDNHSPAHPLARKLRRLPGVSLRRWDRNHGFARAVNEACRLSRGDWFLLLNPDMTLSEGFLGGVLGLADKLEADDARAGIVGFHLRNSDGSQQLSTGSFPTLLSTLLRLTLPRSRRKYQVPRSPERCPVPWVTGCCLLVRRACLQDLGGLDEEYFLYYEDVDLCLRARGRGWSVWYEPNLAVIHHHPLHSRAVPAALRLVTRHSLLTYCAKHWPRWQFRFLARIVRAEAWTRRLLSWWRGDPQQTGYFQELSALSHDLMAGEVRQARERIDRAVRRIDVRVGV
jgi:N-acetylglucosaminyl-diphospho-decaprenol L-rhamnosyltransferase